MNIVQGLVLGALGGVLLWLDWRALATGWLPFGSRGYGEPLTLHRDERPVGFWLAFAMYACVAAGLLIYALRLFAGTAALLPWSK
jgi:hypothetical protein